MRFHTVLFDLDGTLLDHLPGIHASYAHTLPQLGLPAPTLEQVKRAIGGGLENAMRRFVPEAQMAAGLAIYRAYWDAHLLEGVELLPGAAELLRALRARGVTCGVLTNKHGPSARAVCAHLGVAGDLQLILGAKDTPWLKPERAFAEHALHALGGEAATSCLVGDSVWDVQTGHAAGFPCFAVTTGTHSAEELRAAGAAGVYDDLSALGAAEFGVG